MYCIYLTVEPLGLFPISKKLTTKFTTQRGLRKFICVIDTKEALDLEKTTKNPPRFICAFPTLGDNVMTDSDIESSEKIVLYMSSVFPYEVRVDNAGSVVLLCS